MRAGEVERAARADRADVERLERHREVLGRAGRAREVQHAVDAARDRELLDDVGDDELEAGHGRARCATFSRRLVREVVDRDDLVAAREQRLAEVRADEARAAGDDDPAIIGARRPLVVEAAPAHRGRIEQVAGVDDRRSAHQRRARARSRASGTLPTR